MRRCGEEAWPIDINIYGLLCKERNIDKLQF